MLCFVVVARYAETMSFTVFVGHAFNEINEIWRQISRGQGTRCGRLVVRTLLYISGEIGKLLPTRSPGPPKY